MAADDRSTDRSVADVLTDEGVGFEFHQAVRLLELADSAGVPPGEGIDPSAELVRFIGSPALGFPASEIVEVTTSAGAPARLTVAFLGLAGAEGPLPPPYTEMVIADQARGDGALAAFLDIFNHRLISFAYRVRKEQLPTLSGTRSHETSYAKYLGSLIGLGTPALRENAPLYRLLLSFAGLLALPTRSMMGLERLLSTSLGVPVSGRQLEGRWLELSGDQTTRIGAAGRNHRLGREAMLGARVWDQMGGIELIIGPLDWADFLDFLPGTDSYALLGALTRFYAGADLDIHVRLLHHVADAPGTCLTSTRPPRLGWTSTLQRSCPLPRTATLHGAAVTAVSPTCGPNIR
ncbi:MAG: type VI secretion system baseplate subunit TssG [Gemmatimonadales bacterium]|nr:type VI secretion system baseplate subunit TssG [Gemmatimonadales bacterium]